MQPQRKSNALEADPVPLTSGYGYGVDHEPLVKAGQGIHARALQHRLVDAYEQSSEQEKLPLQQRFAVIVGGASVLWLMIGAGIYLVF